MQKANIEIKKDEFNAIKYVLTQFGLSSTLETLTHEAKYSNNDWRDELTINKKTKNYESTIHNYRLWLDNGSPRYTNRVKYNEFFDYIEFNGDIIKDCEEDYMLSEAENFFNHNVTSRNLKAAFTTYVYDNKYNPIVDYLNSLKDKWDGEQRLETFIIKALDAEDNQINRFFTRTWMVAAVKRAFEPGCQFDCVLALQGGVQGSGKTSLIRRIALDKYYKTFSADEFRNKDCIDKMNKSWISVLDEFDKFNDKEVADLKCKITERTMACRKSYGHNTEDYKVHWVYAATTNSNDFLCDLTGDEYERRYWIIECNKKTVDGRVNDMLTDEFVEQLWAEAVHYYFENPNQELYLSSSNELFQQYKEYQRKFKKTANNTAIDYINEILNKKYGVDSKGCFRDSVDMYSQFMDINCYDHKQFINKVPVSYVRFILKKVFNVDYTPRLIKSMLLQNGDSWEIKYAIYLGKTTANVLCRKVPIDAEEVDYSKSNCLPF